MGSKMGQGPTPMSPGCFRRWAALLLLLGMTLLAYFPAIGGGFVWDDKQSVTENVTLRSAEGLRQIWFEPQSTNQQYYPVLLTAFWVQYRLWGDDPLGYHITNISLHAVNACLLWLLLGRLSVSGAFLAAAVFALHPVHVESVAWVTELKNVLSGMFSLLTLLVWVRFIKTRQWQSYTLTLFLFLCGMLSKTAVVTLPLVLLLLAWWKDPTGWRRVLRPLVPFVLIGAVLMLVTMWKEYLGLEEPGSIVPPMSVVERGLLAGRALWFYAGKLFWPATLMTIYPQWEIDVRAPWQYIFPLMALVVPVGLWWSRRQIGTGPLVAVLAFAIILAPALGFVPFGFMRLSYVADHFQYLASIGLIALIAAAVVKATDRLGPSRRWMGITGAGVVLLILGILTWRQGRLYLDAETLWRDSVTKNPQAWLAHNNLGIALVHRGGLEEAIRHYREALRINPPYAKAHYNLGNVLVRRGELEEAIEHYREAVRIDPTYVKAHNHLGNASVRRGELEEAIEHYREALRIDPTYVKGHNNLGNVLVRRGELEEAIEHYREAVRIDPTYATAHNNLGKALVRRGGIEEAIMHFREALRIQPDLADAHEGLGNVLTLQGKKDEAVKHYEEALRIMKSRREASTSR